MANLAPSNAPASLNQCKIELPTGVDDEQVCDQIIRELSLEI